MAVSAKVQPAQAGKNTWLLGVIGAKNQYNVLMKVEAKVTEARSYFLNFTPKITVSEICTCF